MRWWWTGLIVAACTSEPKDSTLDDSDLPEDTEVDAIDGARSPYAGCTDATPEVEQLGADWEVRTRHYRLLLDRAVVDRDEAELLGRLAEAAWGAWELYFDASPAPSEPLELLLKPDDASFRAAVLADGDAVPGEAGGYFSLISGRSYLHAQPTVYYTRVLFLHELTHQFHELTRRTDEALPFWYVEGMAEYLGLHDWDGRCVTLGVRPLATQEDPWEIARSELRTGALPGWVEDDSFPSRPSLMTWWRYLETSVPAFVEWRLAADAGDASYADPEGVFDPAALAAPYEAWLEDDQLPFSIVFVEWLPLGEDRVDAWSVVSSALRAKAGPSAGFGVTHSVPDGAGLGGVLVAYDSPQAHTAVLVDAGGLVYAFEVDGSSGAWTELGAVPEPTGPIAWTVAHDGDTALVTVDGVPFSVPSDTAPATGLALYDATVSFTEIMPSPW